MKERNLFNGSCIRAASRQSLLKPHIIRQIKGIDKVVEKRYNKLEYDTVSVSIKKR